MPNAWKIGRIVGIDIRIDSSWLVIFALITFSLGLYYFPVLYPGWPKTLMWGISILTSLLLFASVLVHELTHSMVARSQGERVRSITLFMFGGAAEISQEPSTAMHELKMAAAGPVASFVLGLMFWGIRHVSEGWSQPIAALSGYLAAINIALGIFNLIPGFPLDGGRVLRALVWQITRNLQLATRIASVGGQVVAFALIFVGVVQIVQGFLVNGVWLALIGWFLHSAAVSSYQQLLVKELLAKVRAKDLMTTEFASVPRDITVQEFMDDYLLGKHQRSFLVLNQGGLAGVVSLHDVKRVPPLKRGLLDVEGIMTPAERVRTVGLEDDGNAILAQLVNGGIHQLPVLDQGEVKGVVRRGDLLEYLHLRSELSA